MKINFKNAVFMDFKGNPILINEEPVVINLTDIAGLLFDAPNELSVGIPLIKRKAWAIKLDADGELDLEESEAESLKNFFIDYPTLTGSAVEGLTMCFNKKEI